MAEKLTPQQEQAVWNRGGKLLVSAAAGSGKTKVLVDRLLSYLMDSNDPANIDDFLIITYTKAAAAELRGKIAAKLSERIAENPTNYHLQRQMQRLYLAKISTVHAFCSDILREYAYKLDISLDFRVAEETECLPYQQHIIEQMLNECYDRIDADHDLHTFIDTQGFGRSDRDIPKLILKVYDSAMCHLNPAQWLDRCIADVDTAGVTDVGDTKWGRYLIDQMHETVGAHITALKKCIELADGPESFKNVSTLLKDTVYQLERLVALNKWDDIVNFPEIEYGDLRFKGKEWDPAVKERIKAIRNACKARVTKIMTVFTDCSDKILEDLAVTGASIRGLVSFVNQFIERYGKLKKARRIMDFGDLEHEVLHLLYGKTGSGITAAAGEIGARFREIMVDEYQDSNEVQDAIFDALTGKRNNLFMVGDVKQSIYQFRLADPGIFLKKYNTFVSAETAEPGEPRKVLLSSNFRSAGPVINAVNDVFCGCMSTAVGGLEYGEDEMLHEGIPHQKIEEPEIALYGIKAQEDTYEEEAAFVADQIVQLLDGTHMIREKDGLRPIKEDDIVILLRAPGSVGMDFYTALEDRGIRCTMGGGVDLLCTEEVRILHALLQTIYNPMLDIPLVTVLSSRVFGFTANMLASIRANKTSGSLYRALKKDESEKTQQFLEILEDLRQYARMNSISGLLQRINVVTKIDSIYASMSDGAERVRNLQAFARYISSYEQLGNCELGQLLSHLEIASEKGINVDGEKSTGCVTIMSIHKSKGLEFPVVFLSALSSRFNLTDLTKPVLCHKDMGLGLSCIDRENRIRYPSIARKAIYNMLYADLISEQMRLLYVAMTRAKDRLIMTYTAQALEKHIAEIAYRIDYTSKELLTSEVSNFGKWILQAVVKRTESGALMRDILPPDCRSVSDNPWKVDFVTIEPVDYDEAPEQGTPDVLPSEVLDKMQQTLTFEYPHVIATTAPSKQTATQLKGRIKDNEAAEDTAAKSYIPLRFRKAAFAGGKDTERSFGNTVHAIMEHIQYGRCRTLSGVEQEMERLTQEGFVCAEDVKSVDPNMIFRFFETTLGQQFMDAPELLREFKFSVLLDGEAYTGGLTEDKVLLQGVVDCALVEDDGITVVDFKTDRVTEETLLQAVDTYRYQVKAYCDALTRIYNKPIKAAMLYFFKTNSLVSVL